MARILIDSNAPRHLIAVGATCQSELKTLRPASRRGWESLSGRREPQVSEETTRKNRALHSVCPRPSVKQTSPALPLFPSRAAFVVSPCRDLEGLAEDTCRRLVQLLPAAARALTRQYRSTIVKSDTVVVSRVHFSGYAIAI